MVTTERVESVLAQVRPVIQADGGNIELSEAPVLELAAAPAIVSDEAPISLDDRIRELEAGLIAWALNVSHGNKSRAAELLQIKRSTLGDRINRCGLGHAPSPAHDGHRVLTLAST